MENFGKLCYGAIILFLSAIIGGYIFMTMWAWFIAPAFNLPYLTLIQSIGVGFFVNYLKGRGSSEKTEINDLTQQFILSTIYSLIVLFLGWVIHLFY